MPHGEEGADALQASDRLHLRKLLVRHCEVLEAADRIRERLATELSAQLPPPAGASGGSAAGGHNMLAVRVLLQSTLLGLAMRGGRPCFSNAKNPPSSCTTVKLSATRRVEVLCSEAFDEWGCCAMATNRQNQA